MLPDPPEAEDAEVVAAVCWANALPAAIIAAVAITATNAIRVVSTILQYYLNFHRVIVVFCYSTREVRRLSLQNNVFVRHRSLSQCLVSADTSGALARRQSHIQQQNIV